MSQVEKKAILFINIEKKIKIFLLITSKPRLCFRNDAGNLKSRQIITSLSPKTVPRNFVRRTSQHQISLNLSYWSKRFRSEISKKAMIYVFELPNCIKFDNCLALWITLQLLLMGLLMWHISNWMLPCEFLILKD